MRRAAREVDRELDRIVDFDDLDEVLDESARGRRDLEGEVDRSDLFEDEEVSNRTEVAPVEPAPVVPEAPSRPARLVYRYSWEGRGG